MVNRSRSQFWGAWALASLALLHCDSGSKSGNASEPVVQKIAKKEPWVRRRTTDPHIALRNLDSRIATRQEQFETGSMRLQGHQALVQLLLRRLRFTGKFDDFATSDAVSSAALKRFPKSGEAHRLRASYLSAVHRFEEALAALASAETLGAEGTEAERDWILLALGRDLDKLSVAARKRVKGNPLAPALSFLAAVEAANGNFDEADKLYQQALDANLDVSPFLFCQILFQRGVMWAEQAGKPERAIVLYREAVRRLPNYVSAQVHLAELEASQGETQAAIARLRGLVAKTQDPEPVGLLAELLQAAGKPGGPALRERAKKAYEQLLSKYSEGFADHASEFFSGPGKDAARGLELAQKNFSVRDTARSRRLVLQAAAATGDSVAVCKVAATSQIWAERNPRLKTGLAQLASGCGAPSVE